MVIAPSTAGPEAPAAQATVTEREASSVPGVGILILSIAVLVAAIVLLLVGIFQNNLKGLIVLAIVLFPVADAGFHGLTAVIAGEARVVQLFGNYQGTVRNPGLQWVNPFTKKRRVSIRIRNHETPLAKVNDADGNPIEISAVVVWQVEDTAKALYAVDDFVQFVATQAETAVRHIATSYAYEVHGSGTLSLRDNADKITQQLSAEIQARVASAGVKIIESRLTRLSYASEIAQAMLRRQAASAVVGARQVIVEGAVGMVKLALTQLEEEGVVELDEERKAAMVSNLLVVLCSEQATQQVVNTGSLYQ